MKPTKNSGMVKHLHHDYLFEWCWGFRERIEAIDTGSPNIREQQEKDCLGFLLKKK